MSVALAMNNLNSTQNHLEGEHPRISVMAIDAQVKQALESDKDLTLKEKGILSIELTPARFIFDEQQKLKAKVSMFYTDQSTRLTCRGIDYLTAPDEEGYRRQFRYSWDPIAPDSQRRQEVAITYTNDLTGDRFSTHYEGFNELDIMAMQEAVEAYEGARNG